MSHVREQALGTPEEILTADEVVARYKLKSLESLYVMRSRGNGPRAFRVGKELRFRLSDLRAWEESRADPVGE
jgi:hypothetical protein